MWQGPQTIMYYKGKSSCEVTPEASLPDKLNTLYARFEADNTKPSRKALAAEDDQVAFAD